MTLKLSEKDLLQAAHLLKNGKIIAFPTETVYGLAAPIFQPDSISQIFQVKGRPSDNPLIAHIFQISDVEQIASFIPDEAYLLMETFFPGPLTLVLPKHPAVPEVVSGGGKTIAFRSPAHLLARKLIQLVGQPLVAPSANLSGKPSPTSMEHVLQDFEGKIEAVIDGGTCSIGIESTVLSLCHPHEPLLLRPGTISAEELEGILKRKVSQGAHDQKPLSPGMKYKHYAPKAKIFIFHDKHQMEHHLQEAPSKLRKVGVPTALNLYAILRASDLEGCEEICFYCDEATYAQKGLMNRLLLAAGKKLE